MNYTVPYAPEAEQQLVQLWMDAPSRAAVSLAADEIDRRLGTDPLAEGELRESGLRILLVPPLGIVYRVSSEDRVVRVVEVWIFRSRD